MSMRSPRSPTFNTSGFEPLRRSTSQSASMGTNNDGIPLQPVRTANSTGARRPGDGIAPTDFANQDTFPPETLGENEKYGLQKLRSRVAGRRQVKKINSRPVRIGTDGQEVSVTSMGKLYNKIVNFSIVTRYFVYVLPVALCIAVPIIVGATVAKGARIGGTRIFWFFLWIETSWLSLWIIKLLSKLIPKVFMFLIGVVSSGTRKYALLLRALEIPISLVGWAAVTFGTFEIYTTRPDDEEEGWRKIVKKLLTGCLIASCIYLGEKLIVQIISIGYHQRSFALRIRESKRNVFLLGLLYDASRTLFPMYCREFMEEDYIINDSIEAFLAHQVGHGHGRSPSGTMTPMRLIGDVGRLGDKVTSAFGNIASEITGKKVFNPTGAHSIVVEALEKRKSSEALAKRLWMSFVVEGRDALYLDDIKEVLGPTRTEEAEEAFVALDNDGNGDISLDEMIMKVMEISRDRKSISNSMHDVGEAISALDQIMGVVAFVVVVFIFVALLNSSFTTTLATAGTTLLSLSFVFSVTAQEFLGSCIFLFIKHPFDVGDRVDISGEYLVVEQISLLYTVFKRIDNMKVTQVPNIVLNTLWIENISRSKAMKEQLDMYISFDTSLEDIELLRTEMENFVRNPDNSRDFQPDIILEVTGVGNMDKLQLKIEIRHKSNWSNETVRASRRSKFMCALVLALRKVPIYAPGGGSASLGDPANPTYSVAVSNEVAAEARAKYAETKEGKRMVPTKPAEPEKPAEASGIGRSNSNLGTSAEAAAMESMNARRPAADAARDEWGSTDNITLASGDAVSERQRDGDIEDLRAGLLKRESTRGRRKPGESAPNLSTSLSPGFGITRSSSSGRMRSVDEEAAVGDTAYYGAQGSYYANSPDGYSASSGDNVEQLRSRPSNASGRVPKLTLSRSRGD